MKKIRRKILKRNQKNGRFEENYKKPSKRNQKKMVGLKKNTKNC